MTIENTQMGLTLGWRGNQVHLDIQLLIVSMSLVVIGYVMVCSASLHLGDRLVQDIFFYPKHQFIHILMGFIAAAAVAMIRLDYWQKAGRWLFVFGLALLVLVLIPSLGIKVNGSTRWLSVFGIRVQVSELFKLVTVIYLADYVTRHAQLVRGSVIEMVKRDKWGSVIKGFTSPCGLLLFACFLLLREPNFGAAVIVTLITMAILFLAGARLGIFTLVMLLLSFFGCLLVYISPYRIKRIFSFFDPWNDPLDTGFQLSQALIAFGRGEWFGVGLGASVQKLDYLPEAHTDFLFSVIGEELGVLGVSTVIILFALSLSRNCLPRNPVANTQSTPNPAAGTSLNSKPFFVPIQKISTPFSCSTSATAKAGNMCPPVPPARIITRAPIQASSSVNLPGFELFRYAHGVLTQAPHTLRSCFHRHSSLKAALNPLSAAYPY